MTITDFPTLALPDQLEFLYAEGVYLSKRRTGEETIILYQLNQLYVEIYYKKYRHIVNRIICSSCTNLLHPYLENISIDDIFVDEKK